MDYAFGNRERLSDVLIQVNRDAALNRLQESGIAVNEWNPESIASIDSANLGNTVLTIVDFQANRTNLNRQHLFGSKVVDIVTLQTPDDFITDNSRQHSTDIGYKGSMRQTVDLIESRSKMLTVELTDGFLDMGGSKALVFTNDTGKPLAVLEKHLERIARRSTYGYYDINLLDDVRAAYKPAEVIEELSEYICHQLIQTIGNTPAYVPYEPY